MILNFGNLLNSLQTPNFIVLKLFCNSLYTYTYNNSEKIIAHIFLRAFRYVLVLWDTQKHGRNTTGRIGFLKISDGRTCLV